MDLTEALCFLGLAILLVGLFAHRFNPTLARWKRLLIIVGVVLILTAVPSFLQGLVDGWRSTGAKTP